MTSPNTGKARHQSAILAIILVSYLMIILDVSIVITGLPHIRDDLAFTTAELSWVQSIYTLCFGGFLLLGARAGDLLGRRRMFQIGLLVFTAASLAIAVAQSAGWMIAARAVQGLGAAILAPSTLALLTITFAEGPERQRATALYGALAGIGASIGLVLGGVLADLLSWRVGFFINLPIGIAMAVAGQRFIHETERHRGTFDLIGAVLSTAGFGLLIWGIVQIAAGADFALAAIVAGVTLIVIFALHESRTAQPIMPLRLFRHRVRLGAYLTRFLYLGAMVTFFFFTTQIMQEVMGFTALQAGLGFLPMTLVNFAVAMAGPHLKMAARGQLVLGVVLTFLGMAWLARMGADAGYVVAVALPMVLIGAGQGLCFGPMTAMAISDVPAQDAGASSGVVNVAHQIGSSFGLGVTASIAAVVEGGATDAAAVARGASAALTAGSVLLGLAIVISAALILRPTRTT